MNNLKHVAVIGGGIMGGGIASFFANNGIHVSLFDIEKRLAVNCIKNLIDPKARIPLLYTRKKVRLIKPYSVEEFEVLKDADMIVEVAPEVMEIKKDIFQKVDKYRKKGSIVCTNTSGLSVNEMGEGCSNEMLENFLGTHYFNPVRFLPLVELIPGKKTKIEVIESLKRFFVKTGKRPIIGKDTPNFVANRVGIYIMMKTLKLMEKYGFSIEETDMITGTPLGNPKTATFRLADMVGNDTLVHASLNSLQNCPDDDERDTFDPPGFLKKMLEMKLLGDKTKKGFYQKTVDRKILSLQLDSFEYKPREIPGSDCVRVAKNYAAAGQRIRSMVFYDDDPVSNFSKELVMGSAVYAMNRIGEIADDIPTIDNAMKWGFNKEIGPIEVLDYLGIEKGARLISDLGLKVPRVLEDILSSTGKIYETRAGKTRYFDIPSRSLKEEPPKEGVLLLAALKEQNKIIRENINARLIDIGDQILFLELDAKMVPDMNPIDDFVISMMHQSFEVIKKEGFKALVIGNQAKNLCAGAQLKLMLDFSRTKRFKEIEQISEAFQMANLALYHADFPVITAPHGFTFGGGMEITLSGQKRVAYAELYAGLVEVGVGLIPAGGGCLMLLMQFLNIMKKMNSGPMPPVIKAFELIGYGTVSKSAHDAMEKGLLTRNDVIVVNKDQQIQRAKEIALEAVKDFQPIPRMELPLPGPDGYLVLADTIDNFKKAGTITPHSAAIARTHAKVLTGGDKSSWLTPVPEDYILEIEREAFLKLCGEPLSQERMDHMLKKGKPLIN